MATVSSPAMVTRVLDNGVHTLLIDEADRSLNPDQPGIDDLIAVLNSGLRRAPHARSKSRSRAVDGTPQ
jgi:hypothetical protein